MTTVIDNNCESLPAFDDEYIYYQGGKNRNQLWRRNKDLEDSGMMIDPHCGSTPAIDGDFVYFQGGDNRDQLLCMVKDGNEAPFLIDRPCGGSPVIDGNYVYYQGGDNKRRLMRKLKDGSGEAEQVDEYCIYPPMLDREFIYIVGGQTGAFLYRKYKHKPMNSNNTKQILSSCCVSSPMISGEFVYFVSGSSPSSGVLSRLNINKTFDTLLCTTSTKLGNGNTKIDLKATGGVRPAVYGNFVLYASNNSLCAKRKDGVGAVISLAPHCANAPCIDDGCIYFVGSSSQHALMRLTIPLSME